MAAPSEPVGATAPASSEPAPRRSEETAVHTRLLRLALGIEESRAYFTNVDPSVPAAERNALAFEQRWFGGKSSARVKSLLAYCSARYDAYPEALEVLRGWRTMDAATRQVVVHWHVQLTDPLYRRFTGTYLVDRRSGPRPTIDRDVVTQWVQSQPEGSRWAPATAVQFASKLLSAGSEAGLVSPKRDPRTLPLPKVTDLALGYLLHLLRGVEFEGTLFENVYLASVGLEGGALEQRLRALPGLTYRRMGNLHEVDWAAPDLTTWAEVTR